MTASKHNAAREMTRQPMRLDEAISAARLWREAGGQAEVELGALEPTLWRDSGLEIDGLIGRLVREGFRVNLTTNGSTLHRLADRLGRSGLSRLRVSWHTTDPALFHQITGFGDYQRFERGIARAAELGLPLAFNRLLFKDRCGDLPWQLDFIQDHRLRLKLYDLYWTPAIAADYERLYQPWAPVVRRHVLPRTVRIERVCKASGRSRLRFHLHGGGVVEVKLSARVGRSAEPCRGCPFQKTCLESHGDYLRVDPRLNASLCYLRHDLAFSLDPARGPGPLRQSLEARLGPALPAFLCQGCLRLILVPFCNYHCILPGSSGTWCLKASGGYHYPRRDDLPIQAR
jgi:cyclic pyranopterin phosphate synthase